MSNPINLIVIHCAATQNGRQLRTERETAAGFIDRVHKMSGFRRTAANTQLLNPHLKHIGYQYVIDTDGHLETGRAVGEVGAHVKGYNTGSIGICLAGTDKFTPAQWRTLAQLVNSLRKLYPNAKICGHRDLSPDLNGDGTIQPSEWIKICPGFTVADWLNGGMLLLNGHTVGTV